MRYFNSESHLICDYSYKSCVIHMLILQTFHTSEGLKALSTWVLKTYTAETYTCYIFFAHFFLTCIKQ